MKARFTIILPVHNGGDAARQCVASILNQSYMDFCLAILENHSTDGTAEWYRSLKDPRVQLFPSNSLLPIEENWARAMTIPTGEFITFIGHDDLLDRSYLAVIDDLIRRNPDAALFQTHFRLIDEHGRLLRHCEPRPSRETDVDFLRALIGSDRFTAGTGYVMRANHYRRVGGIPAMPGLLYADHILWLKLIRGSWLAIAAEECFSIRLHAGNQSTTAHWSTHLEALRQYRMFLKTYGETDSRLAEVITQHLPAHYNRLLRNIYLRALTEATLRGYPLDSAVRATLETERDATALPWDDDPEVRRRMRINRSAFLRTLYRIYRRLRGTA